MIRVGVMMKLKTIRCALCFLLVSNDVAWSDDHE
jgi:hypothetical protein